MFDGYNDNDISLVIDAIDDSVVSDPDTTVPSKAVSQRLSKANGILGQAPFDSSLDLVPSYLGKGRNVFFDNAIEIFDFKKSTSRLCHA